MNTALYNIADALAITVRYKNDIVSGRGEIVRAIEGLSIPIPVEIVSSLVTKTGTIVIARLKGNLACAVLAGHAPDIRASLLLLDMAKCDTPLDSLIEVEDLRVLVDVVNRLKPATVKVFHKRLDRKWREAPVPS